MNNDLPQKNTETPRECSKKTLSLPPVSTVLKRKSEEDIFHQRDHLKKIIIEKTHIAAKEKNIIEPDSDCESNYKDLEAKSQALLNDDRYRKRTLQPRVRKQPPRT